MVMFGTLRLCSQQGSQYLRAFNMVKASWVIISNSCSSASALAVYDGI